MHDSEEQYFGHVEGGDSKKNPDFLQILSVGIDIGSSTSHLMFSRLYLQRQSLELSSRYRVVKREVIFRSSVLLTPYRDWDTIDTEALGKFIARSYARSGIDASRIDTGAVICTGEAAKKKNAEAIVRLFANQGGRFVCATAGHNFEATLAAHGSGAVTQSRNRTILNVDIGGGTCKLAIVKNGAILETAAINIGSRLVAWDKKGKINRIEEAGARIAQEAGVQLEMGKLLSQESKVAMAEVMAQALLEFLEGKALSPLARELLLTHYPEYDRDGARLLLSGGVSEYIYGRDVRDYGDLGPFLAVAIKKRIPHLNLRMRKSAEGLRATVIGASQYTVQVSSSTIFLSKKDLLPIRDLLVVTPLMKRGEPDANEMVSAIKKALIRLDLLEQNRPVALFIRYLWENSYRAMKTLSEGILKAGPLLDHQNPLVLIFDADIGRLVGDILKVELGLKKEVVVIDEIEVGDLDFIDIGKELGHTQAVPVVVKSLVFSGSLHSH